MASINEKLTELYRSHWDGLSNACRFNMEKLKPACPLLIQVDESEYERADIRVMYVGQETWGWGGLSRNTLEERLERYRRFYLEKTYRETSRRSAFWRGVRRFDEFLVSQFPEKQIVNVWNNISKIGLEGRRGVSEELRAFEREFFPVFRKEVEILSPDMVIFLSGPNRDRDIRFHFPNVIIRSATPSRSIREIASLDLGVACRASIRTYHPRYYGGFNRSFDEATSALLQVMRASEADTPDDLTLSV